MLLAKDISVAKKRASAPPRYVQDDQLGECLILLDRAGVSTTKAALNVVQDVPSGNSGYEHRAQ